MLAIAGLWIFFRNVDVPELWDHLTSYNPFIIVICALLPIASLWFRMLRLRLILPDDSGASRKKLFDLVMIEYAMNNILPGRTGDATRGVLLWHRNGFSPGTAIGSVLVERIIDVLTGLVFFALPVFVLPLLRYSHLPIGRSLPNGPVSLWSLAVILSGVVLFTVLLFLLYSKRGAAARALIKEVLVLLPRAWHHHTLDLAKGVAATLEWLFSCKRTVAIIFLSIIIEGCYAASFFLLLAPYDLTGVLASLFIQAFGALGTTIPLAPGYIGTMDATLLLGTTMLNIDADSARAGIIIYHAISFIAVTPIGIYYLLKAHVPFKEITKPQDEL